MTLTELWAWASLQSDTRANTAPPYQITRSSDPDVGERGHIEADPGEVIGGLPFTVRFVTYVDDEETPAPVEKALAALQTDRSQRLEWKIAYEVIHGGHADPETLRAILGCSREAFYGAALRGLSFIRQRADFYLQRELAKIAERTETAGNVNANRPLKKPAKR